MPKVAMALLALAWLAAPGRAGEVRTPGPLTPVYEGSGEQPGKGEAGPVVRLFGARGGAFSGQVVVSAAAEAKGFGARASDLGLKGGGGKIPAAAIEVRYALPTGANGIAKMPAGVTGIFDALSPKPREQGTVHPVWVTVNVPADAAAGEYEGRVSVAGGEVPIRLSVAAWTLPKPGEYLTWVDFIESPESVALRYEVPLWSDRHFELMAGCFAQLGRVGNKTLYLPLAGKSNLGNEQTVVRWIKTGKEKEFKHDFKPLERYLDIFIKNVGKPKVVICHLYENFYGGNMGWPPEKEGHWRGVSVTVLDPETGKTETMEGPGFLRKNAGFPDYPQDTVNFWKPVLEGIRERLKERGLGEEVIAAGLSNDIDCWHSGLPKPGLDGTLLAAAPYMKWVHQGHGNRGCKLPMAYQTNVWGIRFPKDPAEVRFYGWQRKDVVLHNDRDIWKESFATQLMRSRLLGEGNIAGNQRGFGRMSADLWACVKDGRAHGIASRFPDSSWVQLNLRQTPYLYPGPEGALGAVRLEMMREGVQECEARIFIEKALVDKGLRARLGEELAGRCQELLDERVRALLAGWNKSAAEYVEGPWQERSGKLFAAAAEVAAKLGGGR
jgi:hypothetical protein